MMGSTTARAGHRSALAEAALEYAAAGHPVIPLHSPVAGGCSCGTHGCPSPAKHPRAFFGLKSATCELETVEALWWQQPRSNIGLRCDGLVAFDVDGPEGERALERLQEELGPLPPTKGQRTGRGFQHLYAIPDNVPIGNSTVPLGSPAKLDLRAGDRGYVVAAPSLHENGRTYRWLDEEIPFAPLPEDWIERLLLPKPAELADSAKAQSGGTTAYGRAALRQEMAMLARARKPGRNEALNRSVFKLAGWVSAGELDWWELREAATQTGLALGLIPDEVERTVSSAMNAGYARPRAKTRRAR